MTDRRTLEFMAKPYRAGWGVKASNAWMRIVIRAGLPMWTFRVLTVPGRRTGRAIETPLAVFEQHDRRYLVASYGTVNWVRNLRAAQGKAVLRHGKHIETVTAVELPTDHAARVFRASLVSGPPRVPKPIVALYRRFFVLPYLDVGMDSSPQQFLDNARTHPVFEIVSA
ncbi:nitroreductase/quinone reductase family protein [Nocardia sp. 2YAB30]|uniref:nitroreductase/quinone reductase family protein n=1 Tax=Nocardia sp. 2YAB30 TaxID=3233022 RepID=UPI003F9C676E